MFKLLYCNFFDKPVLDKSKIMSTKKDFVQHIAIRDIYMSKILLLRQQKSSVQFLNENQK